MATETIHATMLKLLFCKLFCESDIIYIRSFLAVFVKVLCQSLVVWTNIFSYACVAFLIPFLAALPKLIKLPNVTKPWYLKLNLYGFRYFILHSTVKYVMIMVMINVGIGIKFLLNKSGPVEPLKIQGLNT